MSFSSQPGNLQTCEPSKLPKISLVTPVFNSAKYIEQTLQSVFAQNYPNLEYFVVDGGSTDGTLDIIRKYESQLSGWISEPDNGMYGALNKGFARTTGEVMGWTSATDMLQVGALAAVGSVFSQFPQVEWITGRPSHMSNEGVTVGVAPVPRWSRYRFLAGANRTIQQESTFWRRSLWEKAGARMDDSRTHASDFELWVRFFRHAQLYSVDALIGAFRLHGDSLGLQDMEACYRIHDEIVEAELAQVSWGRQIRTFRRLRAAALKTPIVRYFWRHSVERGLYHWSASDWPPVLRYNTHIHQWVKQER